MKKLYILLFIVLQITVLLGQKNYQTHSNSKSPLVISVPKGHAPRVTEIGFSFWVKGSYSSPGIYNFHNLHHNWPSIAGISDLNNDFCSSGARNRFLSVWLANAGIQDQQPHYLFATYQNNNNARQRYMKFPYERYDYDHVWNFISFTYSFEKHQATAAVLFGASRQLKLFHFDHNHKLTPQDLKFRLGPCNDKSQVTFQGYYHDVNFQYSVQQYAGIHISSEQAFRKYLATRPAPIDKPKDFFTQTLVKSIIHKKAADKGINKWVFNNLNGVHEYAVWGWCKWTYTAQRSPYHLIYRFATHQEKNVADASKIGDRAMAAWVANGVIHFNTYDFDYYGGHVPALGKNEHYDNADLHHWFFIYQGHSYRDHKTTVYIHFNSKDTRLEFNDNWHYLPDHATFYLGKDKFFPAFNGQLSKWNIAFGQGAFRDYYFDDLCGDECSNPPQEKFANLIEPTKPRATISTSGQKEKSPAYSYSVPKHDLKNIQDTSYSFWFRWNFFEKKGLNLHHFHNQAIPLAMLSETGKDSTGKGDRKQSAWLSVGSGAPKIVTRTYDLVTNNFNKGLDLDFEDPKDLDSSWNFMYYGYCKQTKKLFVYVKFGKSGACQTLSYTPSHHNEHINKLIFKLGHSNQYLNRGFNGHFWNVRFYYKGENYLGSREAVDYYYYQSQNPKLYPNYLPYRRVPVVGRERHFNLKKTRPVTLGPITRIEGAEEYAIYGWAKWQKTAHKGAWHILYRFTNYGPNQYGNIGVGDRDLACWVGNGYLHFSAYNYHVNGSKRDPSWSKNINYGGDLEKWFFFYQGYSHKKQRVVMHTKFASSQKTLFLDNVNHFLPFQPYVYLGHDKFYSGFNGWMKNVNMAFGSGAYQENYFDQLH